VAFFITFSLGVSPQKGTEAGIEALSFLLTFFFLDGLTVVKYLALRITLLRAGVLPRRFEALLSEGARIGMLRQVGGGFVFSNEGVFRDLRAHASDRDKNGALLWMRQ
jgi:hypothetical protein